MRFGGLGLSRRRDFGCRGLESIGPDCFLIVGRRSLNPKHFKESLAWTLP